MSSGVPWGVAKQFCDRPLLSQSLGIQMIGEASALGFVMAAWWRMTHVQEKARYDKYYANLRASLAEGEE